MFGLLEQWLLTDPLWRILLVLVVGLIAATYAGRFLRRLVRRDTDIPAEKEGAGQEGYVVSAVMGLLALLIGFTFAMAIDRYDTRRAQVLLEANAIGTTYLRTQVLDEPHRARIGGLLIAYTDNRILLAEEAPGPRQRSLLAENDRLITDLWTATVAAYPSIRAYPFSNSFLEAMNLTIDMDTARKAARRAHVPPQVLVLLFLYQIAVAATLGYVLAGRSGYPTAALVMLLFALSVTLVIDIDRATTGSIRESQEPMLWLQASMKAQPPQVYDRFNAPPP
jgi:hypothetical protein